LVRRCNAAVRFSLPSASRTREAGAVRDYGSGETALLFESGPELDVDALSRGVELEPD
jgi:hypothetical protein